MFTEIKRWYRIKQLQTQLNSLLGQFDNLVSFNVPAGDNRYISIAGKVNTVIGDLVTDHGFTLEEVFTSFPKLDQVKQYASPGMPFEDQVRKYVPSIIVAFFFGWIVLTVMHAINYDLFYVLTKWTHHT